MPEDEQPVTLVVAVGILHRGDDVLLVHQHRQQDPHPTWALPGGRAEAGENADQALVREVKEETGLAVKEIGSMALASFTQDIVNGHRYIAFIMNVTSWEGDLLPNDPDGVILGAEFMPHDEAIKRLASIPWPDMREPFMAAVRGDQTPGALWIYQEDGELGKQTLLAIHSSTHARQSEYSSDNLVPNQDKE